MFGVARAVTAPASRALPIDLAPTGDGRAVAVVAVRSVAFQSAGIVGPLVAGLLFSVDRSLPVRSCRSSASPAGRSPSSGSCRPPAWPGSPAAPAPAQAVRDALEGLRYMRRTPGADGGHHPSTCSPCCSVGAVALLPAIGEKRLGVDEAAVGFLYSAIGIGALITAAALSVRPVRRHVGLVLFGVVAVFGAWPPSCWGSTRSLRGGPGGPAWC